MDFGIADPAKCPVITSVDGQLHLPCPDKVVDGSDRCARHTGVPEFVCISLTDFDIGETA